MQKFHPKYTIFSSIQTKLLNSFSIPKIWRYFLKSCIDCILILGINLVFIQFELCKVNSYDDIHYVISKKNYTADI